VPTLLFCHSEQSLRSEESLLVFAEERCHACLQFLREPAAPFVCYRTSTYSSCQRQNQNESSRSLAQKCPGCQ
jgi:hypothetical protein